MTVARIKTSDGWLDLTGPMGPAGPLQERTTVSYTTASLATEGVETFALTVHPGWRCFRLVTTRAARIQLYRTAAQRTSDVGRAVGTDPDSGTDHGIMLDFVTTSGDLDWALSPTVDMHSDDGGPDFYGRITNLGSTGTVQVTLHYVRTE